MTFKRIVQEIRDGVRNVPRGRGDRRRRRSHIAPETQPYSIPPSSQGQWANLPPELLIDIMRRVEACQISWPSRKDVVVCACVCRSWRLAAQEVVISPEKCGLITFPTSLKQPGPRDSPIQCHVKREKSSSTFHLYLGLTPGESTKLLLSAKKIRRATHTDFIISLSSDEFSKAAKSYVGKLRSNFLGTKFNLVDKDEFKGSSPATATISYEFNVLRRSGPRRMRCLIHSTPDQEARSSPPQKSVEPIRVENPLVLKNKAPRWHEQLQCWCLNFRGRVTVASVKNFQLVAAHGSPEEQERIILQFGKIGNDVFTMDYAYPLSAFQAFFICLSSFDAKPAWE